MNSASFPLSAAPGAAVPTALDVAYRRLLLRLLPFLDGSEAIDDRRAKAFGLAMSASAFAGLPRAVPVGTLVH